MQKQSWLISDQHGWHEPQEHNGIVRDASTSERLCLIHSEVSEALESVRKNEDLIWFDGDKPEGIGIELADVVIRVGDLCEILGIDLEKCIEIKSTYNTGRPFRHGGKVL